MKTTKKHFDIFKKECEYWLKFYGVTGWEICFYHEDLGGERAAMAMYSMGDRNSGLLLAKNDYPDEIITERNFTEELKVIAHHEVCELILGRINEFAKLPYGVSDKLLEDARHEVIMRLQDSVYRKKGQKI